MSDVTMMKGIGEEEYEHIPPVVEEETNPQQDKCTEEQDDSTVVTLEQAEFLMDAGRTLYNSWTGTDAGLPEFQATLVILQRLDESSSDLAIQAHLWTGHAHAKLKHYLDAADAYQEAIRLLEQEEGRYAPETEQAYLALSKIWKDAGNSKLADQAMLQATRIELYHRGPGGPTAQALIRALGSTAATVTLQRIGKSMALELEANDLLQMGYVSEAVQTLRQAVLAERSQGGASKDQVSYLSRKAALAWIPDIFSMSMHQLRPTNCNEDLAFNQPVYCDLVQQAEQVFMTGPRSEATLLYSQAMKAVNVQPVLSSPPAQGSSTMGWVALFFLLLGMSRGLVLHKARASSTTSNWMASVKAWVQNKWVQAQQVSGTFQKRGHGEGNEREREIVFSSDNGSVDVYPDGIFDQSKDERSPQLQDEQPAGQEILPSQECDGDLPQQDDNTNIASSVESLGRLLAGFETEMPELPSRQAAKVHFHPHMFPIE